MTDTPVTPSGAQQFPLLPLRDVVVFPHMVIPLFVGRPKSIKAMETAMESGKSILLVAQRSAAKDDPGPQDMYAIGCVSNILQMLKLPDGTVKVLVEGGARAHIQEITDRFIESVDKLFADIKEGDKVHIAGTENLIAQPEFENPENFRSIIELINNEDIIVHVLEKHEGRNQVIVTIGQENEEKRLQNYSVVSSSYSIGEVKGTVGLIGLKRMDYSKLIPLVDYGVIQIDNVRASDVTQIAVGWPHGHIGLRCAFG